MARKFHPAEASGRFGRPEPATESVRSDAENAGIGVTLRGDYIGATPEGMLEVALEQLAEREKLIADLLRHVPRKFEDKIKALDAPLYEVRQGITAAHYLIENARLALAPVEREAGR